MVEGKEKGDSEKMGGVVRIYFLGVGQIRVLSVVKCTSTTSNQFMNFLLSKTHFVFHITHWDTLPMWHTLSCCNVTDTLKPNLTTVAFNYTELTKYGQELKKK